MINFEKKNSHTNDMIIKICIILLRNIVVSSIHHNYKMILFYS